MGFHLIAVTPLGEFINRDIEELQVKSELGWLTIYENHESLITTLDPAAITYRTKLHEYNLAMTSGVLEIDSSTNTVKIIADALFYKTQIDYQLANEMLSNAKRRLANTQAKRERETLLQKIAEQEAKIILTSLPGRKRI